MAKFVVSAWLASSEYSGTYAAHNLGDERYRSADNERWLASSVSFPQWARADLGTAQTAEWYKITPAGATTQYPAAWTFEGSNDGSSWTTLDTQSGQTWPLGLVTRTYQFTNSTAYRYYRLHITATTGSSNAGAAELEIGDGKPPSTLWDRNFPGVTTSSGTFNVGVIFEPQVAGEVTHLSTFLAGVSGVTYTFRLYDAALNVIGTTSYTTTSATLDVGWREFALTTPVAVNTGDLYMVAADATRYAFEPASPSHPSDLTFGDLLVPANGTFTFNGQTFNSRYGATGAVPDTALAGRAQVGVVFERSAAPSGVAVDPPAATATAAAAVPVIDLGEPLTLEPPAASASASAPVPTVSVSSSLDLHPPTATATAAGVAPEVMGFTIPEDDNVPLRYGAVIGLLEIPTAVPAPAGIDTVPVVRHSHVAPALSAANPILTEGADYPWADAVEVGDLHTFVDGVDVTYLGGAPLQAVRRSATSPAGDVAASFEVPAMQAWDKPGEDAFSMLRPDAPVEHVLIRPDSTRVHLWGGFVSADSATVGEAKRNGFTCDGTLWQAGYTQHHPEHYLPLTDIGTLIPDALNAVPAKRWADVPRVVTGNMSRHRGAGNESVMKYVNDLLAEYGWTEDGRQWTLVEVAKGEIRMQLKPLMDAADATVTFGAKGIEVNLSREQSTRIDVIYGKGVTAHGGQWRGTRFPGLIIATPPEYPNADASTMHLGDTDADTDSGTGISDMQRRLVELGYSLTVDGVLNANDIDVIRRLQANMGLLVDGAPGPQTWSGIFNRGPDEIDLSVWREPIAAASWTQPYFRDPNGVILGPNPDYDPTRIPHEVEIDFGTNITWQQAQPIAERMLLVESEPALTGTITMRTDFHAHWRGEAKPGWRVKVVGFQGEDVIVRAAAVDARVDRDGLVVELTVDERARDAMSVAAVLERNRAAMNDPARRPGNPQRDSRNERDRYVQWDIDSPCGFMPRTALYGGLWVAPNPIPFSEVGQVVRTVMSSTVPFAMMLFGLPVKPSQVQAIVGNPLADSDPYRPHTAELEALGWIEAWGSDGQRLGYYPGDEGSGYAFSGQTDLRGSFDYVSGYGVYVWPVFYSATTGFVGGGSGDWISRFYPGTWA